MVMYENPRRSTREIGRYVNDFDTALKFLQGKSQKTLTDNTQVLNHLPSEGYIAVRLYRTDIVRFYPDGRVELNSGGYHSVTMNQLLPPGFKVEQKASAWSVRMPDGSRARFFDGMMLQGPLPQTTRDTLLGLSKKLTRPEYPGHQPNPRKRKSAYADFGSISSGTLRDEDLIGAFSSELRSLAERAGKFYGNVKALVADAGDVLDALSDEDGEESYWRTIRKEPMEPSEMVDELTDALQEYAPPFGYFGASEGDGADFGFWPSWDQIREAVHSKELLQVNDLSEVPKGYNGMVLAVNDHGNTTLYEWKRGRGTEVWGVV